MADATGSRAWRAVGRKTRLRGLGILSTQVDIPAESP